MTNFHEIIHRIARRRRKEVPWGSELLAFTELLCLSDYTGLAIFFVDSHSDIERFELVLYLVNTLRVSNISQPAS